MSNDWQTEPVTVPPVPYLLGALILAVVMVTMWAGPALIDALFLT